MDLREARSQGRRLNRSRVNDRDFFHLGGGLNLAGTPLELAPGELIGVYNYEMRRLGGYQRLYGYERLDGQTPPSQTPYYLLNFMTGTPANYPVVGDVVNGQTSGATALVLLSNVLTDPNTGYVILWKLAGTFVTGENLRVGANVFGVAVGTANANSASTDALNDVYAVAARESQRALIQKPPGSGGILGVATYHGVDYCFRNNLAGTAAVMYKATSAGWVAVPSFPVLDFQLGTSPINAGDTITGGTSGNTAQVRRVVQASGSWDAGTAAGYLVLADGSPAFVNGEVISVAAVASATTVGTAIVPALAPNGKYDFRIHNFYGNAATERLYGADSENPGFEYQDSPEFFCQIRTGMAVDKPQLVAVWDSRLWLTFQGGSLQPSGAADPVVYSALQGAAEFGAGFDITGLLEMESPSQSNQYATSSMFVFGRDRTSFMSGTGPNWSLKPYSIETGAYRGSVQRLGQGVFLDDTGFATLSTAEAVGQFRRASFSDKINPLLPQVKAKIVCSTISKSNTLYRAFLNDGTFVSIGFADNKVTGHTVCDLSQPMTCASYGKDAAGNEHLLLGGANGYVYQLDSGVNIDGAQITAFFRTAYGFGGTPSRQKRYRRAQADMAITGRTTVSVVPDYSFGDPQVQTDAARQVVLTGGGSYWDVGRWDQFKWDSSASQAPTVKLEDSGLNIAFVFSHQSTNEASHAVLGISLHHSQRRLDRSSQA